jgi:hypothetical protein
MASLVANVYKDERTGIPPTFSFAGLRDSDLDREVLGLEAFTRNDFIVTLRKGVFHIDGGLLHGLEPGTLLTMRSAGKAPVEESIEMLGQLKVEKSTLAASELILSESHSGLSNNPAVSLASVVQEASSAFPLRIKPADQAFPGLLENIMNKRKSRAIVHVDTEHADWTLEKRGESVYLRGMLSIPLPGGSERQSFSYEISCGGLASEDLEATLAENLDRVWNAHLLLWHGLTQPSPTEVQLEVHFLDNLDQPLDLTNKEIPLPEYLRLSVAVTNKSLVKQWMSLLYLGTDFGIHTLFVPTQAHPGKSLNRTVRITPSVSGIAGVFMISVPESECTTIPDWEFLENTSIPSTRVISSMTSRNEVAAHGGRIIFGDTPSPVKLKSPSQSSVTGRTWGVSIPRKSHGQ